jgi:parvulin-like peptidyl-prolyl isomerase
VALPPALAKAGRVARRAIAEPLVQFLIAGLVLFVAGQIYAAQTNTYRIVVTPRHVAQLANDYALQFGTQPDKETLAALVQRDIEDEMLLRQGQALKLGDDDEIVRRRIVQKMQFVMQDLSPPAEPTDAQLTAYYAAHASHYVTPVQATFTHIFFSADNGGDAAARARATATLKSLPAGVARAPDKGDPFPDLYDFSAYEPEQVDRLFGHTPFADAVFSAPTGRWVGPYRSGYGWHLIYVGARQAPHLPPLSDVRDQVRTDYLQDGQDAANKRAFDALARRFTVVRQDLRPGA